MPTLKQQQLGGLGVPSTDLAQPSNQFRDTLNVFQDADRTIYTRSGDVEWEDENGDNLEDLFSNPISVKKVVPYFGKDLQAAALMFLNEDDGVDVHAVIYDERAKLKKKSQTFFNYSFTNQNFPRVELGGVMYFLPFPGSKFSDTGVLSKWDGEKWHGAGLPRANINAGSGTGAYLRAFYITVDFKGNQILGDYSQFRVPAPTNIVTMNPTVIGGAVGRPSSSTPPFIPPAFDSIYMRVTGNPTYNFMTEEWTVPSTDQDIEIGDRLIFRINNSSWNGNITSMESAGSNVATLIAFKVKSISAGVSVVFDTHPDSALMYVDGAEWITAQEWNIRASQSGVSFTSYANILVGLTSSTHLDAYVSNVYLACFTSATEVSGYVLRDIRPVAPSAFSYTYTFNITTTSVTNVPFSRIPKVSYLDTNPVLLENTIEQTQGVTLPFPLGCKYIAQQNGNLLLADDNLLYFSSLVLQGSPETWDGLNSLQVGSWEDGPITGIGATESFIFVSRKNRNYAVIGNLFTGNVQVQPYREVQPGATDFSNIISINDMVMFANQFGIFSATASQLFPISNAIAGLFTKNVFDRKDLNGNAQGPLLLQEASYDRTRNLLAWKIKDKEMLLVVNLNTGEFFFWKWDAATCQFIEGKYYAAKPDATNALLYVEEPTSTASFGSDISSHLVTTWTTLDEPSLEKQFTQIKWFLKSSSNLQTSVFVDWDYDNKIQSSELFKVLANSPLSQKHKIKSNKSLAISISLECPAGERMQVQGYELEFNGIQEGMKR